MGRTCEADKSEMAKDLLACFHRLRYSIEHHVSPIPHRI